jgi:hypothetical protein
MKNLAVVALVFIFNTTLALAAFDCTTLSNKDEMMACLKDLRLLENKYTNDDACSKLDRPKTRDEYKLCVAVEKKKDPCYIYKKYGTREGSDYEKCFIGKNLAGDKSVSDLKRDAKPVELQDSAPAKASSQTSSK